MDEEDNSWNDFVDGAKPISSKKRHVEPVSKKHDQQKTNQSKANDANDFMSLPPINDSDLYETSDQLGCGNASRVDGAVAKKVKSGKYPIDATLDLHGLTQQVAFNKLISFIQAAHQTNKRCILVITGKGKQGKGVIRKHFSDWLNSPHINSMILFYCNATIEHGGGGAYYVLLRKRQY
ncbi:MAG: Smr/MutS family protein [Rickettsiales bacterium]|nr:Smr/MutS family protein [Rickettsiales bacterium]